LPRNLNIFKPRHRNPFTPWKELGQIDPFSPQIKHRNPTNMRYSPAWLSQSTARVIEKTIAGHVLTTSPWQTLLTIGPRVFEDVWVLITYGTLSELKNDFGYPYYVCMALKMTMQKEGESEVTLHQFEFSGAPFSAGKRELRSLFFAHAELLSRGSWTFKVYGVLLGGEDTEAQAILDDESMQIVEFVR